MFITKIFHPNIARTGEICVNVLKRDWKPDMGLRHVLLVIRCLLIQPFPDSALNEEAGRLIMEDYEEFCKHARLMTSIHALPAKRCVQAGTSHTYVRRCTCVHRPMPLTAAGGANAVNSTSVAEATGGESSAPAIKKAKGELAKPRSGAAKSKSLRRL